jgi:hypothetical protein
MTIAEAMSEACADIWRQGTELHVTYWIAAAALVAFFAWAAWHDGRN